MWDPRPKPVPGRQGEGAVSSPEECCDGLERLGQDRSRSGFTLIELMTVIVIIGILTAVIIPEMHGSFENALLRSTSRELISVFEIASSRAISLNQSYRVRLDRTSGRYLVERRLGGGSPDQFVQLTGVTGCQGQLDKRITIQIRRASDDATEQKGQDALATEDALDAISFYPDGTADAAVIQLQDREGFRLGMKLNPITARIHIVELGHE